LPGRAGEGDAFWFHYDASVVTWSCRKRPFRRFVLANIIDKAVGQSGFYRSRILRRLDRADYLKKVDM
jgi:hypothetical protein